jgi:hypothetical protein
MLPDRHQLWHRLADTEMSSGSVSYDSPHILVSKKVSCGLRFSNTAGSRAPLRRSCFSSSFTNAQRRASGVCNVV